MTRRDRWDRKLWGITLTSKRDGPMLLGDRWRATFADRYPGEPSHVLLWTTRENARIWARDAASFYHSPDWTFRAVRVREVVSVIEAKHGKVKP